MSIRTANIEVSLQALTIQRIEHPQANPLKLACTLRAGETFPSGLTVTAEIHTSRNVPAETTPLASSTVTVAPGATSFEVLFNSPQTNQPVAPESVRACWLVLYAVDDADQVHVLSAADLLLGWHAISQLTAAPPAVSLFIEKGGVAWATGRTYASGTMVTVGTTAYVASSTHTSGSTTQPGTGASWATVWAVLSGGGGATDAQLRDRSTHTGTQAISTIVDLQTTLDGKAATTHTHSIADVTGLQTALDGKAATSHTHSIANVTGLQTALDGKAATSHSHSIADVTGLQTALDGKAAATHTHSIANVTGLQTALDGKAATTHTHSIADVTGLGALAALGSVGTSQIDNSAVTYVKMQAVSAASRLLGRGTAGGTAVREISLGSGLSMANDVLSATATGGGTNTIIQKFPEDASFPTTNFATRDSRNNHPVLDFDASTPEFAYFKAFIPQGASFAASGTALTFVIESTATSATTGNVGWGVSLERIIANGIDIDSDAFGTEQTGSAAVNAASGKYSETTINFTLAQLPSGLAAGDMIRICLKRNTAVSGNHSGDAEFHGIYANMTPAIP